MHAYVPCGFWNLVRDQSRTSWVESNNLAQSERMLESRKSLTRFWKFDTVEVVFWRILIAKFNESLKVEESTSNLILLSLELLHGLEE